MYTAGNIHHKTASAASMYTELPLLSRRSLHSPGGPSRSTNLINYLKHRALAYPEGAVRITWNIPYLRTLADQ